MNKKYNKKFNFALILPFLKHLFTILLLFTCVHSFAFILGIKEKNDSIESHGMQLANVQTYTPSILLKNKQLGIKFFNNLYTQTQVYKFTLNKENLDKRETFYNGNLQIFYGVSKQNRINLGLDLNLRSVLFDSQIGSPAKVFNLRSTDSSRTALSSIGPKIKIAPFKKFSHFSIQSTFSIPIASNLEQNPWLDYNRYVWWNQFFYDHTFNNIMQIFLEGDLQFRFPKKIYQNFQVVTPLSGFVSYFLDEKSTIFTFLQYAPTFTTRDITEFKTHKYGPLNFLNYYVQIGFGAKYQITDKLQTELIYTRFVSGYNAGAGETFNIGFRYIR